MNKNIHNMNNNLKLFYQMVILKVIKELEHQYQNVKHKKFDY